MKKKLLISLVTLAIMFTPVLMVAYQAQAQDTLRVYAPPWIHKKFPLEDAEKRFEQDHPGVNVKLTKAGKWSAPKYITEWKTGDTPFDVFVGGSGSMLGPVIAGNWLEPMGDMLTGKMSEENFVGGFLAAGHYKKPEGEGTYYPCLPFMGEVAIIGVNTDIMEKAGLWEDGEPKPIPDFEDTEAFYNYFEKIKEHAPVGAHVQIWDREFMQYNYGGPILAMSGTFQEVDGKGFDISSEYAKKWLSMLAEMDERGLGSWVTSDDAGYSKWKTGAAGSFFAAQGHIMELVSVTEDESDIAYVGWPGSKENGSIIWTHSVWVPKVSDRKALAEQFIREQIYSPHFQQWSFNNYGKLPVMKDYYGDGITWFQDQMDTILSIANASKPIPLYEDIDKYLDILKKYLPQAASGEMKPDVALEKIEKEIKNLDFSNLRAN